MAELKRDTVIFGNQIELQIVVLFCAGSLTLYKRSYLDTVAGCERHTVLHPAHGDVGTAQLDVHLNVLTLPTRHVTQAVGELSCWL